MKRLLAVPLLSLILLASACTSPADDPGVATVDVSASPQAATEGGDGVMFAKCLREHGQNVPDPQPGGPQFPQGTPEGTDPETFKVAVDACQKFLPGGTGEKAPDPAELERLRAFAVCMRAHDIEMTDPLPDGNMKIVGRLEFVTRAQLEADPGFIAAMAACKDKLPEEEPKKVTE